MIVPTNLAKFKNIVCGFGTKKDSYNVRNIIYPNQVHGRKIVLIKKFSKNRIKADGLLTLTPNLTLAVRTADCVPIIFFEKRKKMVGIIHAGWKGTIKNIAGMMVRRILQNGGALKDIFVAIGPAIGVCCYNIARVRARHFQKKIKPETILRRIKTRWHLDLKLANKMLLISEGIEKKNIETSTYCTSCFKDFFYSFRKEGGIGKRKNMINFVKIEAEKG